MALANSLFLLKYFSNNRCTSDTDFICYQLKFCWIMFFIIFYQILLSVKTGYGYQLRPSLILCWIIWLFLETILCLLYINTCIHFIEVLIILSVIILIGKLLIQNPNFNEINFLPNTEVSTVKQIGNDIVTQLKTAEQKGEYNLKLNVPKFESKTHNNWPIANYAGDAIAKTLRKHGIIKKELKVTIVPNEEINKYYSVP